MSDLDVEEVPRYCTAEAWVPAVPADVATEVGFYDQAHFTRHFKAAPARFSRSHA